MKIEFLTLAFTMLFGLSAAVNTQEEDVSDVSSRSKSVKSLGKTAAFLFDDVSPPGPSEGPDNPEPSFHITESAQEPRNIGEFIKMASVDMHSLRENYRTVKSAKTASRIKTDLDLAILERERIRIWMGNLVNNQNIPASIEVYLKKYPGIYQSWILHNDHFQDISQFRESLAIHTKNIEDNIKRLESSLLVSETSRPKTNSRWFNVDRFFSGMFGDGFAYSRNRKTLHSYFVRVIKITMDLEERGQYYSILKTRWNAPVMMAELARNRLNDHRLPKNPNEPILDEDVREVERAYYALDYLKRIRTPLPSTKLDVKGLLKEIEF